ncbi:TD and POZ domain-containing protein 4 [Araneus ventricosus]|uniref:TD and POZ domain-containing protein 4 n=1 Tax=Araneus ventricosus TaxID=182803 RepID=A0A4Y2JF82_ARAVE|nr:TD and POZ domain-containing protein 4 [Araneus ventricosus]
MDVGEEAHFTIIWRIENFSFPCCVSSPSFFVKDLEMTKWSLEIECTSSGPATVGIWREHEDGGPKSIEIKCQLSFLDFDGLPIITIMTRLFKLEDGFGFVCSVPEDAQASFLRRRAELLQKDTLNVRCRMRRTGTEVSNPDLCFAHTLLRADRRILVWAIREFSTLQQDQVRKFLLNPHSTKKITFNFFIRESEGKEFVNIDVHDSGSEDLYNIEISLLDFEGKVRHSEEKIVIGKEGTQFENFIKKELLTGDKELLPNDVLLLRLQVEMNAKIVGSRIENYIYLNPTNLGVIATDAGDVLRCEQYKTASPSFRKAMKSLLEEGISSDVSLQTGGQSFPAHKCILSARSAVFRAMFNTDMLEKTSECVPIPDLSADTLRELLSYIYTDKVGELQWQAAADLYSGADKYQLLDLKESCASILKCALSVSNFSAILSVADMHQDRELQEAVHDFVMRQGETFFTSDEWRSFREKNSVVAWKIVDSMFCNMKRNNGKCPRLF